MKHYLLKEEEPKEISVPLVSVVNENRVNIDINITFEMAIKQIEENGSLNEEDKKEIICEIIKLEEISKSAEKKVSKWQKAKPILLWLADKGVDIGITLLPLIYQAVAGK